MAEQEETNQASEIDEQARAVKLEAIKERRAEEVDELQNNNSGLDNREEELEAIKQRSTGDVDSPSEEKDETLAWLMDGASSSNENKGASDELSGYDSDVSEAGVDSVDSVIQNLDDIIEQSEYSDKEQSVDDMLDELDEDSVSKDKTIHQKLMNSEIESKPEPESSFLNESKEGKFNDDISTNSAITQSQQNQQYMPPEENVTESKIKNKQSANSISSANQTNAIQQSQQNQQYMPPEGKNSDQYENLQEHLAVVQDNISDLGNTTIGSGLTSIAGALNNMLKQGNYGSNLDKLEETINNFSDATKGNGKVSGGLSQMQAGFKEMESSSLIPTISLNPVTGLENAVANIQNVVGFGKSVLKIIGGLSEAVEGVQQKVETVKDNVQSVKDVAKGLGASVKGMMSGGTEVTSGESQSSVATGANPNGQSTAMEK